jgi:hypothetical protein
MLQSSEHDVAYCYERAEENRRMADAQVDGGRKRIYLDLQQRWLVLALSYQLPDRLNQCVAAVACALGDAMRK